MIVDEVRRGAVASTLLRAVATVLSRPARETSSGEEDGR